MSPLASLEEEDGNRPKGEDLFYFRFRNRVQKLVKHDMIWANLAKLRESHSNPKILWELANAAIGKNQPDGIATKVNMVAANTLNSY